MSLISWISGLYKTDPKKQFRLVYLVSCYTIIRNGDFDSKIRENHCYHLYENENGDRRAEALGFREAKAMKYTHRMYTNVVLPWLNGYYTTQDLKDAFGAVDTSPGSHNFTD